MQSVGSKYCNDPKAFIEYSDDMDIMSTQYMIIFHKIFHNFASWLF